MGNATYKSLSVGRLIGPSVGVTFAFSMNTAFTAPAQIIIAPAQLITAPAKPPAGLPCVRYGTVLLIKEWST